MSTSNRPDKRDEDFPSDEQLMSEALMTELVKLRKKLKMGQAPIAKAIGMTQSRVSQMENLRSNVNLETVLIYAKTVGAKIVVIPENPPVKKSPVSK